MKTQPTLRDCSSTTPARAVSEKTLLTARPDGIFLLTQEAPTHSKEITFLACLKLTTLFVFGFFDMIMTPAYIAAGEPLLKTAGGNVFLFFLPRTSLHSSPR